MSRKGRGGEEEDTCTAPCTPSGTWLSLQRKPAAVHAQSQAISQPASETRSARASHLFAPTSPPVHTRAQASSRSPRVHASCVARDTARDRSSTTQLHSREATSRSSLHTLTQHIHRSGAPRALNKPEKKGYSPYLLLCQINNTGCVLMYTLI